MNPDIIENFISVIQALTILGAAFVIMYVCLTIFFYVSDFCANVRKSYNNRASLRRKLSSLTLGALS